MGKTIVLLLFAITIAATEHSQSNIKIEDFNNDGYDDTLVSYYEGGSGFGGRTVRIKDGYNKNIFELNNYGPFSSIKCVIVLPPQLLKPENKPFLNEIQNHFIPDNRLYPDPSLDWIIESSSTKKELKDNEYFDIVITPQLKWIKGEIENPESYCIEVHGEMLASLINNSEEAQTSNTIHLKGLLIYYGHNHCRNKFSESRCTVQVEKSSDYTIFRTSHGIIAQKGSSYKWLFVGDADLTSAPEKLRWESIGKTALVDNYLILQHNLHPNNLYKVYIINIETGMCGRIKHTCNWENEDKNTYLMVGKKMKLSFERKIIEFELEKLFNELDSIYE